MTWHSTEDILQTVERVAERQAQIVSYVAAHPGCSQSAAAKTLTDDNRSVTSSHIRSVKRAIANGYIICTLKRRSLNGPARYALYVPADVPPESVLL